MDMGISLCEYEIEWKIKVMLMMRDLVKKSLLN